MNDQANLFKVTLKERSIYIFSLQLQTKFETDERNMQEWFVATWDNIKRDVEF